MPTLCRVRRAARTSCQYGWAEPVARRAILAVMSRIPRPHTRVPCAQLPPSGGHLQPHLRLPVLAARQRRRPVILQGQRPSSEAGGRVSGGSRKSLHNAAGSRTACTARGSGDPRRRSRASIASAVASAVVRSGLSRCGCCWLLSFVAGTRSLLAREPSKLPSACSVLACDVSVTQRRRSCQRRCLEAHSCLQISVTTPNRRVY